MHTVQTTTRLVTTGLLLAVLLSAATAALAQLPTPSAVYTPASTERSAFYLESIRPAIERLQSLTANPFDDGIQRGTPNEYEVNYSGRISLNRSFARGVGDMQTVPLGVAFQDTTNTKVGWDLSRHTGLGFTNTVTTNENLVGLAMGQTQINAYSLRQALGSGVTAGALNVTRTLTQTNTYMAPDTTTQTDVMSFAGGLRRANDLNLKTLRTESDAAGGYLENTFEGSFNAAFSGGDSLLAYARSDRLTAGVASASEKLDLAAPIAWRGQKALAEFHALDTENNGLQTRTRMTHLLLPFATIGANTFLDLTRNGVDSGYGMAETTTTRLSNPFSFRGKTYGLEENYITLRQAGLSTDTMLTKLSAPLAGGQALVQHQSVDTDASGVLTEQEALAVTLPAMPKLRVLSASAGRTTTTTSGTEASLTNMSVSVQAAKPLEVSAAYAIDDRGENTATKTRQLQTRLAVSKSLMVRGHLAEAEVLGGTANVLRLVEVARDQGTSGLGLKAGYASYDAADQTVNGARRLEMALGKPQGLLVNAAYSEYDTSTFALIPNDALVALSLQHGDPKDFAVRCRYEDQPTRIEPLRAVDMAMPALGGALVLSYQNNPVAPDGVTIRQAAQWDAGLTRKVFGDVNLQLGYRYLDYDVSELVDRNIRIQLDGGSETGAGKMAVAYFTGDFTTTPSDGSVRPGSSLDVSYTKSWGALSKLTLAVQRRTAPWHATGDTATEGRLEYSLGF